MEGNNVLQRKKYLYLAENGKSSGLSNARVSPVYRSVFAWTFVPLYAWYLINDPREYEFDIPLNAMEDAKGISTGYSKVTEIIEEPGRGEKRTEYRFTDQQDYPDIYRILTVTNSQNGSEISNGGDQEYSQIAEPLPAYCRGLLKEKRLYSTENTLVQRLTNTYDVREYRKIPGAVAVGTKSVADGINGVSFSSSMASLINESVKNIHLIKSETTDFHENNNSTTTTKKYVYNAHQLIREIVGKSDGDTIINEYTYSNRNGYGVVWDMIPYNISLPIERITYLKKGNSSKVIDAEVHLYKTMNLSDTSTSFPLLSKVLKLKTASALDNYVKLSYDQVNTVYDSRLEEVLEYTRYNINGLSIEQKANGATLSSAIYGYWNSHLIASVENSPFTDIAYAGFEDSFLGGWRTAFVLYSTVSQSFMGGKSFNLALNTNGLNKYDLSTSKTYLVSYWTNATSPLTVSGTVGNIKMGATINGWSYFEHLVKNVNSVTVSGTKLVDELKLRPASASMTTYTLVPTRGLTSITDPSGNIQRYEYDTFGRLSVIKDLNGDIVKGYCYNYAGQQVDCGSQLPAYRPPETYFENTVTGFFPNSLTMTLTDVATGQQLSFILDEESGPSIGPIPHATYNISFTTNDGTDISDYVIILEGVDPVGGILENFEVNGEIMELLVFY
ncbi:RHS repeat domain-containing protein [Sphingobacterium sp. LRF_L2]|uniref:RHS repeat domain-containing protein n=1 Tax=Sphingobacterium sp. LRF_L2 TaxID=3369421 RepID=UPI003F61FDD0